MPTFLQVLLSGAVLIAAVKAILSVGRLIEVLDRLDTSLARMEVKFDDHEKRIARLEGRP